MIDLNKAPLIPDWSHYQAPGGAQPDWPKIYDEVASGQVAALIFKATENMAVDSTFETFRQKAIDGNVPWMCYSFLRPGDTTATIEHAIREVGPKTILCIDFEAANLPVPDAEHWQTLVEHELGRPGLMYRGRWLPPLTVNGRQVSQEPSARMLDWLWWYPQYPSNPNSPPAVTPLDGTPGNPPGRAPFLWQYTGNGRLGGVGPATDLSRLCCPLETFKHWYATGELIPWAVSPVPAVLNTTLPIGQHSSGLEALEVQRRLIAAGFSVGATGADSHIGPMSWAAILRYEQKFGLPAGPVTLAAMASVAGA